MSLAKLNRAARKKPHIFFKDGYWRVSTKPKPFHKYNYNWSAAVSRKMELNYRRSLLSQT